ncbi:GYD domain-containing protein [Polaromonas sp.]|uniref:GYD domain-containing protein n=1 Tax=Polaromonas sp. TaxID=1869339 RepID=UPI00286B9D94|nr:GYD domain-containing protein [Polaromonas sp.]
MATYIALSNFTDQGIRSVKDTTKRADAVKEAAGRFGAKMTQIYWTQGAYDVVAIIEAPDDESATTFALAIGVAGNIRTQTLRAFSKDEMNGILAKLAS